MVPTSSTSGVQQQLPRGVVTVVFTDIVASSRLKQLMEGETSARRDAKFAEEIKQPHDELVRRCVEVAGGHLINTTGDGFCFAFADVEEAVLCALRIQEQLGALEIQTPAGPLRVRIGVHTGMSGHGPE